MQTYGSIQDARNAKHESNDCAVCAVAISTGTEYDRAHALLAQLGRRPRGRTSMAAILKAITLLGFEAIDVTHLVRARTVSQVPRHLIAGSYMVGTAGHVLAVKDGVVEDWTAGRQHRVRKVWRIVKAGEANTQPEPVVPAQRKALPTRRTSVKQTIWGTANAMWLSAGKPTDVKVIAKLRIQMMNVLESQGIKRTSASTELGQWQKSVLCK